MNVINYSFNKYIFLSLNAPLNTIVCPKLTLTVSSVIFLSIFDTAYWLRRWRSTCWGHRKEENVNSQQTDRTVFLLHTVICMRKTELNNQLHQVGWRGPDRQKLQQTTANTNDPTWNPISPPDHRQQGIHNKCNLQPSQGEGERWHNTGDLTKQDLR